MLERDPEISAGSESSRRAPIVGSESRNGESFPVQRASGGGRLVSLRESLLLKDLVPGLLRMQRRIIEDGAGFCFGIFAWDHANCFSARVYSPAKQSSSNRKCAAPVSVGWSRKYAVSRFSAPDFSCSKQFFRRYRAPFRCSPRPYQGLILSKSKPLSMKPFRSPFCSGL